MQTIKIKIEMLLEILGNIKPDTEQVRVMQRKEGLSVVWREDRTPFIVYLGLGANKEIPTNNQWEVLVDVKTLINNLEGAKGNGSNNIIFDVEGDFLILTPTKGAKVKISTTNLGETDISSRTAIEVLKDAIAITIDEATWTTIHQVAHVAPQLVFKAKNKTLDFQGVSEEKKGEYRILAFGTLEELNLAKHSTQKEQVFAIPSDAILSLNFEGCTRMELAYSPSLKRGYIQQVYKNYFRYILFDEEGKVRFLPLQNIVAIPSDREPFEVSLASLQRSLKKVTGKNEVTLSVEKGTLEVSDGNGNKQRVASSAIAKSDNSIVSSVSVDSKTLMNIINTIQAASSKVEIFFPMAAKEFLIFKTGTSVAYATLATYNIVKALKGETPTEIKDPKTNKTEAKVQAVNKPVDPQPDKPPTTKEEVEKHVEKKAQQTIEEIDKAIDNTHVNNKAEREQLAKAKAEVERDLAKIQAKLIQTEDPEAIEEIRTQWDSDTDGLRRVVLWLPPQSQIKLIIA